MKVKKYLLITAVTLAILLGVPTFVLAQGITADNQIKQPVKDFYLKQVTISQAISKIAVDYQICIGVEVLAQDRSLKMDLFLSQGTVEDIINQITSALPNYEWSIDDNVITILPQIRQENVLDVFVKEYNTKEKNDLRLRQSITDIPEVKERMKQLGVEPFHVSFGSLNGTIMKDKFALNLQNVTVKKILNELSKRSSDKYWIITRGGDNGELLFIYL